MPSLQLHLLQMHNLLSNDNVTLDDIRSHASSSANCGGGVANVSIANVVNVSFDANLTSWTSGRK